MKQFKNILYVVEPGRESGTALERAVILAENNQARLTVVTVIPPVRANIGMVAGGLIPADLEARTIDNHKQELETLIKPYLKRNKIETRVLVGTTFLEVIRDVMRHAHDLVIKCPESPDWLDRFFSGDDMHLLRKCPCPVWMVRPEAKISYHRILAAVDVDDNHPADQLQTRHALNTMIMELAGSLAVSEFAELHVVNVWDAFGESSLRNGMFMQRPGSEVDNYVEQVRRHHAQLLDTLINEVTATLGQDAIDYINPQLHMPKGIARKEIPELTRLLEADCIIMGTVACTGVPGLFMGNTAETILEQLDCPVLAVKPPGFVSPITLDD